MQEEIITTPPLESPDLTFRSIDDTTKFDAVPLRPARSGWEPGLVFEGSVVGEVINAERIVCRNLLEEAALSHDEIIVQTGQVTKQSGFSVGADLANDLLPGVDVGADLAKLQRERVLRVSANRAEFQYYTLADQIQAAPARSCLNAIALLKERGQFDNRVFVVPAVFAVQGITYSFTQSTNAGGEVRASIAKVVDAVAEAGYQKKSEGEGTTILTNDGWITLRTAVPVLIKEWDVSGAVGAGDQVKVMLGEMMSTELEEVNTEELLEPM